MNRLSGSSDNYAYRQKGKKKQSENSSLCTRQEKDNSMKFLWRLVLNYHNLSFFPYSLSLSFTDHLISLILVYAPSPTLSLDFFYQTLSSDFFTKRQVSILKQKMTARQNWAWCYRTNSKEKFKACSKKILPIKYSLNSFFFKERSWQLQGEEPKKKHQINRWKEKIVWERDNGNCVWLRLIMYIVYLK